MQRSTPIAGLFLVLFLVLASASSGFAQTSVQPSDGTRPSTRFDSCPYPPCPPVPQLPPPPGGVPQTDTRFLNFWEQNGGMFIFGYPLTQAIEETLPDGRQRLVQWFERARLEIYADNPNAVYVGTLGLELRGFVNDPVPYQDGCLYFDDTQQPLCEPFLSFWLNHGIEIDGVPGYSFAENVALFGQPIATPRYEIHGRNSAGIFLSQWFERARLEYHPENAGTPYQVLPGRLGMELYSIIQGPLTTPLEPAEPAADLDQPVAENSAPADPTSGECAANAPTPEEGAQAWVTNDTPAGGDEISLCVRLTLNNEPVAGAEATGLIQYESGEEQVGITSAGSDGIAVMPFFVNETANGEIALPVLVRYEDQNYTAQTSFTVN